MGVNFTPLITPLNLIKIQIENHEGRLRLRWHDADKMHTLALGVKDTPVGRSLAHIKKAEIELDWQTGHYDRTLLKYRPRTIGKTATEILAPELFRLFGEHQFKYKGVSRSSIESRYKPIVLTGRQVAGKPDCETIISIEENHWLKGGSGASTKEVPSELCATRQAAKAARESISSTG